MIHTKVFRSISALEHFCQGGIAAGEVKQTYSVDGLELTFTNPASTVVLAGHNVTLSELIAQIQAAMPDVRIAVIDRMLCFIEKVPTTGIVLAACTARAALGFGGDATVVSGIVVHKPGGADATIITVYPQNAQHVLVYDDGNLSAAAR